MESRHPRLDLVSRPSVANQVFDDLYRRILSLELPPGMKLSEVEVAKQMGVSRQPVRDAFYRLSNLGFLVIRPQRATTVSLISGTAVRRARFVRTAIEMETCRAAATLSPEDFAPLDAVMETQRRAMETGDGAAFHAADDLFHETICVLSGHGYAWDLVRENKAHTDRIRLLSLSFGMADTYAEHASVLEALRGGDPDAAAAAMRTHLASIHASVKRIQLEKQDWFAEEE